MAEILHTPSREYVVASNVWAFLHWLRTAHRIDLPGWAALQQWSATHPAAFGAAMAAFARLPDAPLRLARHPGPQEALVLCRAGERIVFTRDMLADPNPNPNPLPQSGGGSGWGAVPPELAAPLTRLWPPALLLRPLAELLLHADLRPDDRLLVAASPAWPWLAALLEGTTIILAAPTAVTLLATAAQERATVLVAPAQTLAEAAFQRPRSRPDLARLRTIIATGGPLSPEGRTRIYTWIKPDLTLLARTGDTLWGNPLEPVYARPAAAPALLTPPPSAPAPR